MAYVATALARRGRSWTGTEIDIEELADVDVVVDALRDVASDGEPVLLLVEENDEWFGIVRVDGDEDPRLFLSDARVLGQSETADLLFADAPAVPALDGDEESTSPAEGDPVGDPDLLADLGTPAGELLALCAQKGLLPGDVLTAISERAGCLEPLEELRGP